MLTKEQWSEIEEALSYPYGRVALRCDGHDITAAVERGKGLRYVIAVYIDGYIRWQQTKGEPDHVRKFWREEKRYVWPTKKRQEATAALKKRGLGKELRDFYQRVAESVATLWVPLWPNAQALCRHLRKTCSSIERIQPEA